MIKVEKGMREIKAVNGVPDIMTDLACIIRSIRTTMVEKRDYSEAETKELVKQAEEFLDILPRISKERSRRCWMRLIRKCSSCTIK